MPTRKPKESPRLREERVRGTENGLTLRTRVARDRTKYTRKIKHRKSPAEAGDFPFSGRLWHPAYLNIRTRTGCSLSLSKGIPVTSPLSSKRQSTTPRTG